MNLTSFLSHAIAFSTLNQPSQIHPMCISSNGRLVDTNTHTANSPGEDPQPQPPPPPHSPRSSLTPATFRQSVREGRFHGATNGVCPGYVQCNLVVLRGKDAFDFLLFCQRNKKACPLIEVLDVGSYSPSTSCTPGAADLRTDLPMYRIFQHGKLIEETSDVTQYWPDDSVAFLIGCSFTTEAALLNAGIRLRSVEQHKNVPMYKTNIPCAPAGQFAGNMVVSMKPIKALDVVQEIAITSKFPHAHGAPVSVGAPAAIGIEDVMNPDFGDAVDILDDEVPVFHACGVTAMNAILASQPEFAITHSPGCMMVTDLADLPSAAEGNVYE